MQESGAPTRSPVAGTPDGGPVPSGAEAGRISQPRILLGLALVVAAAVLGAVYLLRSEPATSLIGTEQLEQVTIAVPDTARVAVILVAQESGLFEGQGLSVELRWYRSGKLALAGMLAGEVDLATSADVPIMKSIVGGDDIQVIATIAETNSGQWIVARRHSGISTVGDLRGKIIATQEGSAVHFFLDMFLLANGIAETEVEIVFMPAVDLAPALIGGDIDAISMRDPFNAEAKLGLGEDAVELYGPGIYIQTLNLVAMREYINENATTVEKIAAALTEAADMIKSDPESAQEVVVRALGTERRQEVLDAWARLQIDVSLNQSLLLTLENEFRWNHSGAANVDINFLDYIYVDALEAVRPEAVSIFGGGNR